MPYLPIDKYPKYILMDVKKLGIISEKKLTFFLESWFKPGKKPSNPFSYSIFEPEKQVIAKVKSFCNIDSTLGQKSLAGLNLYMYYFYEKNYRF